MHNQKKLYESEISKLTKEQNTHITTLKDTIFEDEKIIDALKNEGNIKINELNKDYSVINCERNMLKSELILKDKNFYDFDLKIKE